MIQRLLVTDDGTETGNPVMDISGSGNITVFGRLQDAAAHAYITGYTETDPEWTSVKGNYYTKNQIDSE